MLCFLIGPFITFLCRSLPNSFCVKVLYVGFHLSEYSFQGTLVALRYIDNQIDAWIRKQSVLHEVQMVRFNLNMILLCPTEMKCKLCYKHTVGTAESGNWSVYLQQVEIHIQSLQYFVGIESGRRLDSTQASSVSCILVLHTFTLKRY